MTIDTEINQPEDPLNQKQQKLNETTTNAPQYAGHNVFLQDKPSNENNQILSVYQNDYMDKNLRPRKLTKVDEKINKSTISKKTNDKILNKYSLSKTKIMCQEIQKQLEWRNGNLTDEIESPARIDWSALSERMQTYHGLSWSPADCHKLWRYIAYKEIKEEDDLSEESDREQIMLSKDCKSYSEVEVGSKNREKEIWENLENQSYPVFFLEHQTSSNKSLPLLAVVKSFLPKYQGNTMEKSNTISNVINQKVVKCVTKKKMNVVKATTKTHEISKSKSFPQRMKESKCNIRKEISKKVEKQLPSKPMAARNAMHYYTEHCKREVFIGEEMDKSKLNEYVRTSWFQISTDLRYEMILLAEEDKKRYASELKNWFVIKDKLTKMEIAKNGIAEIDSSRKKSEDQKTDIKVDSKIEKVEDVIADGLKEFIGHKPVDMVKLDTSIIKEMDETNVATIINDGIENDMKAFEERKEGDGKKEEIDSMKKVKEDVRIEEKRQ